MTETASTELTRNTWSLSSLEGLSNTLDRLKKKKKIKKEETAFMGYTEGPSMAALYMHIWAQPVPKL